MQTTKYFSVRPNGPVKSGAARYSVDHSTGDVVYEASVTVGLWPFSKTLEAHGVYQVEPRLLRSPEMEIPGRKIQIGQVIFDVTIIEDTMSMVGVSVVGQPWTGVAWVETCEEYWELSHLRAKVKVPILGTLNLDLEPADPPKSFLQSLSQLWRRACKEGMVGKKTKVISR